MKLLATILILFTSLAAQAVCMTEIDADAYGCLPMHNQPSAVKWCKKKFGEKYKPYITDNTCSKELAAVLRGESYNSSKDNDVVEAACMTYEQGMENGCQYYDYMAAQRYCAENYGNRYIPFIPDNGKCSMARASGLRGELAGRYLIEGLKSEMDEIETIMTMIDREGLNPLGGLEYKRPKIGNEFYTDTVQALMAKMNSFKNRMYKNGLRNVPLKEEETAVYLKYAFRYLNVLARLYKVYAHVAHENHVALKTYTFKNLDYLNLKLKKEYALEILARANYRAKTVEEGKALEFIIGQQERQTYELLAMQDPYTKKDYAKLVTFLGVRENLTNLWGVQRMTPDHISNAKMSSCGNFLSFRPGPGGAIEDSSAYKELFEYDVFYSDYAPRWEALAQASQKVSILNETSAADLGENTFKRVRELKELVLNQQGGVDSLRSQAANDAGMLIEAENAAWMDFSYAHFSTIVMPGDSVLHKNAVMERIAEEAYQKRLEGIVDVFIASYLWVSDAAVKKMERELRSYADRNLKRGFVNRMKSALREHMRDYNSASRLASQNRKDKEEQTYQAAKKAVIAVNVLDAIENNALDFSKMTTIEPTSIEELFMLFQDRVERDFKDLRQTLKHNDQLAASLNGFFQEIAKEFKNRFVKEENGQAKLIGSSSERSRGLREIAYKLAKKYYQKHPFDIARYKLRERPVVAQDNTRVATSRRYIPVLKDGSAAGMSKKELLDNLPSKEDIARQNYVVAQDNTRVANTRLYLGATKPLSQDWKPGRSNPDRMTTGDISKPLAVSSPGKLKTERGEVDINNGKLVELFKTFGVLSAKAKAQSRKGSSVEKELKIPDWGTGEIINQPGFFYYRVFEALRLERVGMSKKVYGRFAGDVQAQKLLANNIVSNAYQSAPILRNEHKITRKVKKYCFTKTDRPYRCDETKTERVPLLELIAFQAYDRSSNKLNVRQARGYVGKTVSMAIDNTDEKLASFCDVNYLNYKNDPDFKVAFRASKFLRSTINAPVGKSESTVRRLSKLDAEITKEIRSKWQVLEEDYLMPALDITMYVSLGAFAVVLILGSAGTALPAVFAGVYGLAGTVLAWDLVIGMGIGAGNAIARYNTHFVETPAQLRFQESLATSQVDFAKVADWGMIAEDRKKLRSKQIETGVFLAMDMAFTGMLVNQIRVGSGMIGKKAFKRLTGVELKGWSAPPRSMLGNKRFSQMRKEMGLWKALGKKGKQTINTARAFMPKYQAIPENMIKSTSLRMGLVRRAKQMNIGNSPWAILEDLKGHTSKLSSNLDDYKKFTAADGKVAESARLNRWLKPKEVFAHYNKTAALWIPKALWKRVRTGNIKEVYDFFAKYGDVWDELKRVQGAVVKQRVSNIEKVAAKLEDFQKGVRAGQYKNGDYMEKFIRNLTDNEILALEEVARKSKGIFGNFKRVFKDYNRVVRGLKPMSYLSAYNGQKFGKAVYPQNYFMDGQMDAKYAFESDAQDLINFYESMMNTSAANSEAVKKAREAAEDALARKIRNQGGKASDY